MNAFSRSTIILGVLASLSLPGASQLNNSLYFMHGVPQANRVNPAYQPNCGFYVGFPFLAPVRAELSSSSFAYGDIIYPHPAQDSLITFLHPLGDKQAFQNQLKPLNAVVSDLGTSLASLGFRTGAGFFSIDITTRMDGNVYFPGDLANLIIDGAEEGMTYQLDGIAVDLSAFDEVSVGWSLEIMDGLQVGARAKMLFGIGNLSTQRSDLMVTTSRESWNLQSDMMVSASTPFADVIYDEDGMIEDIVLKEDLENPTFWDLPRYMFNFQNLGFGVDLGVNYRPIDQLLLSASVTDLGLINWKDEITDASYKTEYEFLGIEVNPLDFSDDYTFNDYLDSTLSQIADSLVGFLVTAPGSAFSKRLNTKLYVGASYFLTPNINFGILSRTDFLNGKVTEQLTASANYTTGRFFNASLSYSYINSYFKNIGAGISFNAGPVNLYLVSDNVLNALFWPQEARSVNLWVGLNLVFGYKQFMEGERDRPLVR